MKRTAGMGISARLKEFPIAGGHKAMLSSVRG